jgi:hypothetical protein
MSFIGPFWGNELFWEMAMKSTAHYRAADLAAERTMVLAERRNKPNAFCKTKPTRSGGTEPTRGVKFFCGPAGTHLRGRRKMAKRKAHILSSKINVLW